MHRSAGRMLLNIGNLKVSFRKSNGRLLPVIDAADLSVNADEAVGIVGESGSGKTMLCRAIIGTLSRHDAVITSGEILYQGRDLANAPESVWRQVRGREIGYVPQSSLAGLNPILTIGSQLVESIEVVRSIDAHEAERQAVELLEVVRIPRAKLLLNQRPHQLSGGMRQRVMIATALAQKPKLLIADEPTTALDVTTQREILTLLGKLREEFGMALILVSHDLAVVEEVCGRMMVMYAGATVETGAVGALNRTPRHPYTNALRVSRVDTATPGKDIDAIPGDSASVGSWPEGCRFWPRCTLAIEACRHGVQPPLRQMGLQQSACIRAELMGEN